MPWELIYLDNKEANAAADHEFGLALLPSNFLASEALLHGSIYAQSIESSVRVHSMLAYV